MTLAHNLAYVTCLVWECVGGQLADGTSLFKKFLDCVHNIPLTFELWGWYLNFSAWFTKTCYFLTEKYEIVIKLHFVENKTEIMQYVLKMQ
jgi:hypothetical protein